MKPSSILIAGLLLLACAAPAGAMSFMIEPELGVKVLTGDAKDIVGSGVAIGGTLGLKLTPQIVLTARGDLGFHPAEKYSISGSTFNDIIDAGATVAFAGGARFLPMGGSGQLQPYIGGQLGFSVLAWSYKDSVKGDLAQFVYGKEVDGDGLGSFTLGGEAGMIYMVNETFGLSAGGRVILHAWSSETSEGLNSEDFKGSEFGAHAGFVIEFGQ